MPKTEQTVSSILQQRDNSLEVPPNTNNKYAIGRKKSKIDDIYQKVFQQYSDFSKNFEYKAPKQREDLKEFLDMFDDGGKTLEQTRDATINVQEYIATGVNFSKTEAYYCTKVGQIKGILTLKDYIMQFDPLNCEENKVFPDVMSF